MATLLTGATGFVGLNLARTLAEAGEAVVLFAPRPPPPAVADADWFRSTRFVAGDVRADADLDRAFAAAPVRRVLHAAALTPDAAAEAEHPDAVAAVNLVGTTKLMLAARRAGVGRVLALGSVAAYGDAAPDADGRLDEQGSAPRPSSLYGITKLAAEQAVLRLAALHGTEAAVVRLGPCFGVGEHPTGHRPLMSPHWQCAEAALRGDEAVLPRPMRGDWIDAAEAAAALAALLDAPHWWEPLLNLGGGSVSGVDEWCAALAALRPGFRWRVDAAAATIRTGLAADRVPMGNARLRAALGWAPDTAGAGGLAGRARRYLEWREGPEGRALCAEVV